MNKYKIKLYIVCNEGSGGNSGKKTLRTLLNRCKQLNIDTEYRISDFKGHTVELVQKFAKQLDNYSRLVVIGGDGTLNEALFAVKSINSSVALAYLPAGTGNDFARSLKISKNVDNFLQKLLSSQAPKMMEVIKFENLNDNSVHYALNNIGFGFDALIVNYSDESKAKNILKTIGLGKLAYLFFIFKAYKNKYEMKLDIYDAQSNKHTYNTALIACLMNHPSFGGGIKLDPYIKPNDHSLSFIIAENIKFSKWIKILSQILRTSDHLEKNENLTRLVSNEFTIDLKTPAHIQFDGEIWKKDKYNIKFSLTKHLFWL